MNRLAEERAANGPFKDLFDVAERLDQRVINKRLLESLVKAGAFDSLNKNRAQTFGAVEALTRHSQATHESRGSNQNSLFGDDTAQRRPPLPKVPDWAPMERLQNEFAAIGFYLSSHPLAAYERSLERLRRDARGRPAGAAAARRAGPHQARRHRHRPPGAHLGQGQPLRLRAVLRPVRRLRAHRLQRASGQQAQSSRTGAGDPGLGRRAARRRAGQADGADGREARGCRRQCRRRPAHRAVRSRRARAAAQGAGRQARPQPRHAGRADARTTSRPR